MFDFTEDEISNEDYHKRSELGASNIKKLLENPYKFFNNIQEEDTKAKNIGSAVHCMVLEPDKFNDLFTTKPLFLDDALEGYGKTRLTDSDMEIVEACTKAVFEHAGHFFVPGVKEQAFFAEIEGKKVKCKPDNYIEKIGLIVDLKVVIDASPDGFLKAIGKWGYYIQAPHYIDTVKASGHKAEKFLFIAVEKEYPYMVGMYEIDEVAMEFGRSEIARAFNIHGNEANYKEAVYRDPTTGDKVQTLSLPSYVFYKNGSSL